MGKSYYGSINFSKLLKMAKEGHTAFSKAKNGDIYCNVNTWVNDTPDEYGNILSMKIDKEYISNQKESKPKPIEANELPNNEDLPF